MRHPDDRVPRRLFALAIGRQESHQSLGMLVDIVGARTRTMPLRSYIRVVSIHQDIGRGVVVFKRLREEISRPEDAILGLGLGCPCLLRFTVEAVDENDVDLGLWMRIDCCYVKTGDFLVDCSLLFSCQSSSTVLTR